jgi:transcription antitermination factor NusG
MTGIVSESSNPPGSDREMKWLIAYTLPKAERKVLKKLETLGISAFLPMQKVVRNWSDRKKKLEVPLFPNYIFVHAFNNRLYDPLKVKEIVRYVSFNGRPAIVPESLIDSLRKMLNGKVEVSNEEIKCGMRVRVEDGPFMGIEGKLTRYNGESRLVIELDVMRRIVSVEISKYSVKPIY